MKKKNRNIVFMIRTSDRDSLKLLGQHIKHLRFIRKMSQEQLAFSANISLSQISRIELGKHNTTFSTIVSICKAMNITIATFFESFDYPAPVKAKKGNPANHNNRASSSQF